MRLNNLKIKSQILIVLAIPVIGMIFFLSSHIIKKYHVIQKRDALVNIVMVTPIISSYISELQKERAFSSLYILNKGSEFYKEKFNKQKSKTDKVRSNLELFISSIDIKKYESKIKENINNINFIFRGEDAVRKNVLLKNIKTDAIMSNYTSLINKLISIMSITSFLSHDPNINIGLSANNLLERVKEYAGRERALGYLGISSGIFNHNIFHRFESLKAKQQAIIEVFNNLLTTKWGTQFIKGQDINSIEGESIVSKVRKLVVDNGERKSINFKYTSEEWFNAATERINKISYIQSYLLSNVLKEIKEYNRKSKNFFILDIFNASIVLFVTLFMWWFVEISITEPIEETTKNLKKLADDDLSFKIEETNRGDEIGDIIRTMVIFKHNILERKKYYEQQRVFISMVSHEFRTPLTIIDGNAQIIQRRGHTLEKEVLGKRAVVIRTAVDRLVGLIETILSDSVLSGGELTINPEMASFTSIVKDSCMEKLGVTPNAQIKLDIDKTIPEMMIDSKVMHHVVMNLISNAFKYSPDNPTIGVRLYKEDDNAILEISDSGLGIPEDELPKIFTRYFRASTSGGISGTGLGLNLVKEMVELHGGKAYIESQVDIGTTVTIEVPIVIKNKIGDV